MVCMLRISLYNENTFVEREKYYDYSVVRELMFLGFNDELYDRNLPCVKTFSLFHLRPMVLEEERAEKCLESLMDLTNEA